jgi:hypothetical protein
MEQCQSISIAPPVSPRSSTTSNGLHWVQQEQQQKQAGAAQDKKVIDVSAD